MKILIVVIFALVLLITPCMATGNCTGNMTEAQVLHGMELARYAGMMDAGALASKTYYDQGTLPYADYWTFIKTANRAIREYNTFILENFNQSVQDTLKLDEYSL